MPIADDQPMQPEPELPDNWVPAHEAMEFLCNVYRDPASSDGAKRHAAEGILWYWFGQQLNALIHIMLAGAIEEE